jgi:hypothetical protein
LPCPNLLSRLNLNIPLFRSLSSSSQSSVFIFNNIYTTFFNFNNYDQSTLIILWGRP